MAAFPLCKGLARVVARVLQGLLLHFAASILAVQGLQGLEVLLIYIGEKKNPCAFFLARAISSYTLAILEQPCTAREKAISTLARPLNILAQRG
jgi:hypothetical protein